MLMSRRNFLRYRGPIQFFAVCDQCGKTKTLDNVKETGIVVPWQWSTGRRDGQDVAFCHYYCKEAYKKKYPETEWLHQAGELLYKLGEEINKKREPLFRGAV